MFPLPDPSPAARVRLRVRLRAGIALALAAIAPGLYAAPANLGNGLGKLVDSHTATAGLTGAALQNAAPFDGYTTEQVAALARLAITDSQGRFLVRINADGRVPLSGMANNLSATLTTLQVKAVDAHYRHVGVMDAWISLDEVSALAGATGVRSVILELKPYHAGARAQSGAAAVSGPAASDGDIFTRLGSVFDQGVTQHRVDQINRYYNPAAASDYEGNGMSIGFMSNSYAANAGDAQTDVNNFDLPGAAGNPVNTQAVTVLEDDTAPSDDEGRAMVEIGFKMAPKAKLAFATANFGEVDFANNIRALAGIPANMYPGQTFAADTICDDVGYFDEPFFQDGIIGAGVDDAAAFGVSYFSSAANDIGVNGYDSDLRWVPNGTGNTAAAGNTALAGTNIDLTNVPPELYAGGFHNFNPNPGQLDVAQTVGVPNASGNPPATVLQWNEPYDQTSEPDLIQPPVFTGTGTITSSQTQASFTVPASLTAGGLYELTCDADPGSAFDCIISISDPSGNPVIDHQDTEVDETARFFAPVTGSGYTITVNRFSTTTGAFTVNLYATNGFTGPAVKTRISLLAFTTAGVYVPGSSLTDNVLATNEPIQLGVTPRSGGAQLQYVFARANVPTGPNVATHIRYLIPGNGASGLGPSEYFSYNTVTTGGHAMAKGSNGTAAYSVFRPSLPETFSSPGPVRIYFDSSGSGDQLALPEIRQQPRIAAADGANNTVLSPNFFGTSAAGPHAAAIAALVLEAHGGRHSITPTQMTTLLQHSTFPHDLDPSAASGVARTANGDRIAIRIASDGSNNTGTGGQDANAFTVTYTGASSLATLVFNPQGTAATGGNASGGANDVTNVSGSTPATVRYTEVDAPGLVFAPSSRAFTIGSASSIVAADVSAAYTNAAPAPSSSNQWWTMTLTFNGAAFTQDKVLHYTVGRDEQHSSDNTTRADYLADLFGGGVILPSGQVVQAGMTFSGTTTDGQTFSGTIQNRIGAGYSPVDGFGFINAEQAVGQAIP